MNRDIGDCGLIRCDCCRRFHEIGTGTKTRTGHYLCKHCSQQCCK
jgi:hypothetical protein